MSTSLSISIQGFMNEGPIGHEQLTASLNNSSIKTHAIQDGIVKELLILTDEETVYAPTIVTNQEWEKLYCLLVSNVGETDIQLIDGSTYADTSVIRQYGGRVLQAGDAFWISCASGIPGEANDFYNQEITFLNLGHPTPAKVEIFMVGE